MAGVEGITFEPRFGLLVCRVHGCGVHPDVGVIKRHLRGKRYFYKGIKLREAVAVLLALPLKSRRALEDRQSPIATQPIPAIPHLNISSRWNYPFCDGRTLTTSEELRDRHASKAHHLRASSHSEENPL